MVKVRGKLRPFDPPSIFNCVDKSLIPTPSRPTKRTSSGIRSIQPDEMAEWLEREKIKDFDSMKGEIKLKILTVHY